MSKYNNIERSYILSTTGILYIALYFKEKRMFYRYMVCSWSVVGVKYFLYKPILKVVWHYIDSVKQGAVNEFLNLSIIRHFKDMENQWSDVYLNWFDFNIGLGYGILLTNYFLLWEISTALRYIFTQYLKISFLWVDTFSAPQLTANFILKFLLHAFNQRLHHELQEKYLKN